ncbi:TIGR04282 family arsenosugar biosynthesis glycosyltransferase [Aurantivibrio plasticivorans]
MHSPSVTVVQMLKSPASNNVKTRLSSVLSLGDRQLLHWQMVEAMAMTIHEFCQLSSHDRRNHTGLLAVAGDLEDHRLVQLSDRLSLPLIPQQGEDLGQRMWNALNLGLTQSDSAIVVGSDCPFINLDYLHAATDALSSHDVVLGPATDGGYVLLGVSQYAPIFSDIAWGTDNVLAQTLERLQQKDISHTLLADLDDIDRPDDLRRLSSEKLPTCFHQWENYV